MIVLDSLLTALSRQKIEVPKEEPPVILTYTRAERRETVLKAQKLRKEGKPVALRQKKEELK